MVNGYDISNVLQYNACGVGAAICLMNSGSTAFAGQMDTTPMWIWLSDNATSNEEAFFKTSINFDARPKRVTLIFTCDNQASIFVGGQQVASTCQWEVPVEKDITKYFDVGSSSLIVHAKNQSGPAGFVGKLDIENEDGTKRQIITNSDWLVSSNVTFTNSQSATELGPLGSAPWSQITNFNSETEEIERNITVPLGFAVDLIYTVPRRQGSWVSLAVDPKGRLIASGQSNGLYRITVWCN